MIRIDMGSPHSDYIGGINFREGIAELDKMPSYAALAAVERLVGEGVIKVDVLPDPEPVVVLDLDPEPVTTPEEPSAPVVETVADPVEKVESPPPIAKAPTAKARKTK